MSAVPEDNPGREPDSDYSSAAVSQRVVGRQNGMVNDGQPSARR